MATDGGSGSRALPVDPDVTRKRLANGFSYLLKPAKNEAKAVELTLIVRVGSAAEREDEQGYAHFVEHVAFDQRFGELEPREFARRSGVMLGPDVNATTARSYTLYRLLVPNPDHEALSQALDLLKGFASGVQFDDNTVERQRKIIRSEQALRADHVLSARQWHLFRGSPFAGRNPGGTEASIQAAKPARLEAFYRRWYRPPNLAIVAVGQLERVRLSQLIDERFGGLPHGQVEPAARFESVAAQDELMSREAAAFGLQDGSVEFLSRLPASPLERESDLLQRLVDHCLANLMGARLERLWLQQPSPLAARAELDIGTESTEGQLNALRIRAVAKPGQLRAAVEGVLLELKRAQEHGFGEGELVKARAAASRWLQMSAGRTALQAETDRLVHFWLFGDERMSPAQKAELGRRLLATVDRASIRTRLADWLQKGDRSLLALRAGDERPLPEEDLRHMAQDISARKTEPVPDEGPRTLLTAPPTPGNVLSVELLDAVDVRVWRLQNGAQVVFKPLRDGSNSVLLRAVSPGGRAHARPLQYANALLAENVVRDSGLGAHGIDGLLQLLEGTGADVAPWLSNDFEGIRGSAARAELELMLQLAHLYVTSPRADRHALERYRASLREPPDPARAFSRAIHEALYPGNARLAKPDPEALDLDEMLRFYRDRFGNVSDFAFVIVGETTEGELRPLMERYIASLPGAPRHDRLAPLRDDRPAGITRVHLTGRASRESAVRLEFQARAIPSARARVEVDALTAHLEAALSEVLRHQRAAVYAVTVGSIWSADTCTVTIAFSCSPADVSSLREATWKVIGQAANGEVSDSALRELQVGLRERYIRALRSGQFWADQLAEAFMYGIPPADILALPELSSRITRESLVSAAKRYLRADHHLDAVWSPAAAEEP